MSGLVDSSGAFPERTYNEDVAPSTIIQTFSASDNDLGEDGSLTYTIVSVTVGECVSKYCILCYLAYTCIGYSLVRVNR